MNERDLMDGEGTIPSLVSLALFAIVFCLALTAMEFGPALTDPVRAALADLPKSVKAGALAAFILGIMAIVRIGVLLSGGGSRGDDQ